MYIALKTHVGFESEAQLMSDIKHDVTTELVIACGNSNRGLYHIIRESCSRPHQQKIIDKAKIRKNFFDMPKCIFMI